MNQFEEISTGFHDIFLNKFADSTGPILDFYVSDSMQDMLDIDILSEVATVVGGVSEFTSLMNDLPSLDLESNSHDGDILWSSGQKWPTTNDIYADVGACINPNSVHTIAPVTQSSILMSPKAQLNLNTHNYHSNNSPLPSPKEKKSHLTFSPNTIKVPDVQEAKKQSLLCQPQRTSVEAIKKDLIDDLRDEKVVKLTHSMTVNGQVNGHITIKLAAGIGGLSFANSQKYAKLKQNNSKIVANGNVTHLKRDSSPLNNTSNIISNNGSLNGHSNGQKMFARSISVQNGKSHISTQHHILPPNSLSHHTNGVSKQMKPKITGREFPKPAYSYSCFIAMALKNSRAGSLPVSEIYSFMCEHFPYFKTAPNGWKNSVRHNLSLNKCFEKIEKPVTNGGQRKCCLWAMNPSKITKMDEEIKQWSRNYPMAIRKAMVFPDNLDLLEKGEMKQGSTGDSEGENEVGDEDTETNTDSEQDVTELDDTIQNTTETESRDEDDRPQIDYDIEVTDLYDDIDLNDANHKDLLSPEDIHPAKRARLDINYSIGPAGTFQSLNGSQQPQQNRRKMTLVNRIVYYNSYIQCIQYVSSKVEISEFMPLASLSSLFKKSKVFGRD